MAYFVVKYINPFGETVTERLQADSTREAKLHLGDNADYILSLKIDYFGGILAPLINPPPSLMSQAIALQSISAALDAGKSPESAALPLAKSGEFKATKEDIEHCETLADYLRVFECNSIAITLAEAGDASGRAPEAMNSAAEYLLRLAELKATMGKGLRTAVIWTATGILFLFGCSYLFGGMIERFQSKAMKIPFNEASDLLVAIRYGMNNYSFVLPFIIVGMIIFRKKIWDVIKEWKICNVITSYLRINRAVAFVSNYQILNDSGATNAEIVKLIMRSAPASDLPIYNDMIDQLEQGVDLNDVLNSKHWPSQLLLTFEDFSSRTQVQQKKSLESIQSVLRIQQMDASGSLSSRGLQFGGGLIITFILLVVFGFMLPIASVGELLR